MANMVLQRLSAAQITAVEQINRQMQQLTKAPGAPQGQQMPADPQTIKALQEFMKLPMLKTVTDAREKADIARKIIDLGKLMPDRGATDGPNLNLTQEQIDGAIRAISCETNGEYNFHYIGTIVLLLLGMYLLSSAFSLIMDLVMSGVALKPYVICVKK